MEDAAGAAVEDVADEAAAAATALLGAEDVGAGVDPGVDLGEAAS